MQVCGFIRQWVEDNVLNHIANDTHAKTLWDKLESLYASKTGNNKLFLLKQAIRLQYKEGSSVLDHVNEFQGIFDRMSGMGVKFDEDIMGLWLLNTLPDSWENFRVSLTNSAPDGVVTMQYVKSGILNEEVRRRTQVASTSHSDVLVVESRGRSKSKGQYHNRGKSRSKSKSRYKNLECHYCGKTGHIKKYCFKWKRENKGDKGKQEKKGNDDSNDRVSVITSIDLAVVLEENMINVASNEILWVLDSGAAHLIASRR